MVSVEDRPFALPLTDKETLLVAAYQKHKSVWKAATELGLTGQTVHKRLKRLGYVLREPEFTLEQTSEIVRYYETMPEASFDVAELANSTGKSRQNIARFARKRGLTKQGRTHNSATLAKLSGKPKWVDRPHPRGMAGKRHIPEVLAVMSAASRRSWATMKTFGIGSMSEANRAKASERMKLLAAVRPAHKNFSRAKAGRRDDLGGLFLRSSWEANYARYLNLLMRLGVVEKWDYEPEVFWFEGIRRGVTNYRPDFRIKYKGDDRLEYVEIKGWIVPKDRVKWRRMAKYHPQIKLVVVAPKDYYALQTKWKSSIPDWETAQFWRSMKA